MPRSTAAGSWLLLVGSLVVTSMMFSSPARADELPTCERLEEQVVCHWRLALYSASSRSPKTWTYNDLGASWR